MNGLPVVEVVAATAADLTVLATDRAAFARRVGSPAPGGWPEYPQALAFTIDRLTTHPQEAQWWMHFFLVNGLLVGSGGFVGRPRNGEAEIGYEIAPGFRRRHYGTGAAAALVAKAFGTGEVTTIVAHTVPQEHPSTRVLSRIGFAREAEVADPHQGTLWRWRLNA
jgi:RimJ/RimL family protein N-acetyltransferase